MKYSSSLTRELEHITQEMYKKNLELAERNKTLSLLRQIEEIVLSAVTDIDKTARQVADTVIRDAGFKAVFLHMLNHTKTALIPLTISVEDLNKLEDKSYTDTFNRTKIPLHHREGLLIKAVTSKQIQKTSQLYFLYMPSLDLNYCHMAQKTLGMKLFLTYPLIVRDEVMGTLTLVTGKNDKNTLESRKGLVDRLPGIVAIALDNALLYKTIQDNNERLKELDRLKTEFVSIASHELRTPMTAIKSYVWLALHKSKGKLDPKLKEYLTITYSSVERMIKLVQNMLTVSRIEGKRLKLTKENVRLDEVIGEVYKEFKIKADESNIQMVYDNPKRITIQGDKEKLREVVQNLLGNALKFTSYGGKITINTQITPRFVETSITDTGPGISQENLGKLFQKFGMLGASYIKTGTASGTGLGLYITKQIVALHKGQISVKSQEGKGSTFSFKLPVKIK